MKRIYQIIFFWVLLSPFFFSQVNYESLDKSVYNYLDNMAVQGYIVLNTEIKPFTRMYIATKLKELYKKYTEDQFSSKFTKIEYDELLFYISDFSNELRKLGLNTKQILKFPFMNFGANSATRFHLFYFVDSLCSFILNPILGYEESFSGYQKNSHRWNGLELYGSISNFIGFDLNFRDNNISGEIDTNRFFSPETGYSFKRFNADGNLEFDEVNANLTFSNKWASLTLGKDYLYYGEGSQGKIIIGNKAPSFPHIKIEINPVKWFRFSYVYGSLNSQIVDSSTIRINESGWKSFKHVSKYYVAHYFSFTPWDIFNFSFGESIIYSDRFEPIYLIPILFFRLADHYLTVPDNVAGNAQLFGSFWYNISKINTRLYGSLFIDELSIEAIFKRTNGHQALAYTLGTKIVNPFIKDMRINVEYTKIDPFVYFHRDDAQFYSNYNYQLGHWIGSNADQFYYSVSKTIIRGLELKFWYSYIRRGARESKSEPRYQKKHVFLWGLNTNYTRWGLTAKYEIVHDLFVRLRYNNFLTSEEQENGNFVDARKSEFYFAVYYGM